MPNQTMICIDARRKVVTSVVYCRPLELDQSNLSFAHFSIPTLINSFRNKTKVGATTALSTVGSFGTGSHYRFSTKPIMSFPSTISLHLPRRHRRSRKNISIVHSSSCSQPCIVPAPTIAASIIFPAASSQVRISTGSTRASFPS